MKFGVMSCHSVRSVHGNKSLSPVQRPWAELQNATDALHRHPGTSESSGAKVVTHKSLPTCLTLRSTRLLRCDTGRHLWRHRRHIFSRCMRPALVLPIVDPSPQHVPCTPWLRLSGLPPARCGGRLLRLVSFGQLVGGRFGHPNCTQQVGRSCVRLRKFGKARRVTLDFGAVCPHDFTAPHLRQPVPDPTFTVGATFQLGTAPHCFCDELHIYWFIFLSPPSFFLYFLGFISLRSSAVALEFSLTCAVEQSQGLSS